MALSKKSYLESHKDPSIISIMGPLLFHIFMCDLFPLLEAIDFTGCADKDTRFVSNATH